jgi:hypothetical protein
MIHRDWAPYIEEWSHVREASEILDTPWDDARRVRRTVSSYGEVELIDRGANFIVDLVQKAGCQTFVSCEGHPRGAYLGFLGDDAARSVLEREFERLGWRVEHNPDRTIVRMPEVRSVGERDSEWRRLSREFDYSLLADWAVSPKI